MSRSTYCRRFQCKDRKQGNKEAVSKGERQFKRLIGKYNLSIINANEKKCKINNRLSYYQSIIYGKH